jgi:hypothetical protein
MWKRESRAQIARVAPAPAEGTLLAPYFLELRTQTREEDSMAQRRRHQQYDRRYSQQNGPRERQPQSEPRSEWNEDDERRFPSQQEYGESEFGRREYDEDEFRRGYGYRPEEDERRGEYGRQLGGYGHRGYGQDEYREARGREDWQRFGSGAGYGRGGGYGERFGHGFTQGPSWERRESSFGYGADYGRDEGRGRQQRYGESDEQRRGYGDGGRNQSFGAGHAGRGPKGYRRSDQRVLEDVNQALEDDDEVDASNIEVACEANEIVLRGTVPERRMKRLAEDLVEGLPGVKDVRNELRVSAEGQGQGQQAQPGGQASRGGAGKESGKEGRQSFAS